VERGGTRVKKFNVSEPRYFRGELLNFTEYRKSATPGDFEGAVFLVLFYAKKVLGVFRGQWPRQLAKHRCKRKNPCPYPEMIFSVVFMACKYYYY
jgi:hypothetical protein